MLKLFFQQKCKKIVVFFPFCFVVWTSVRFSDCCLNDRLNLKSPLWTRGDHDLCYRLSSKIGFYQHLTYFLSGAEHGQIQRLRCPSLRSSWKPDPGHELRRGWMQHDAEHPCFHGAPGAVGRSGARVCSSMFPLMIIILEHRLTEPFQGWCDDPLQPVCFLSDDAAGFFLYL